MSSDNLSTRLVEIEAMLDRSRRRFEEGSRLVEEAHRSLGEVQQLLLGSPVRLSPEDGRFDRSRNHLDLTGRVTIHHDDGTQFVTESAAVAR